MADLFGPYRPAIAKFSIRGACGFVLTANPEVTPKMAFCPDWQPRHDPITGTSVVQQSIPFSLQSPRRHTCV
jgi:hypothetical protein